MADENVTHPLRDSLKQTSDRLSHLEERINNQAAMVSSFSATLQSYGKQLETQNDAIKKIFDIVSKPNKVNYGWWIAALGLVTSLTFSFTAMVTNPMKETQAKMGHHIEVLQDKQMEAVHRIGRLESKGDLLDTYININSDRVASLVDTAMELKGRVDEMSKSEKE